MKNTLLSLLLTISFAAPAFAQNMDKPMMGMDCDHCQMMHMGGDHGQMMGMGQMDMMVDHMGMCLDKADKIGLTDEQVKKITSIHREIKKKNIQFKADLQIAKMEQMEIMEVKDFDLVKANASVKKIADMKTAHHLDMLKSMKEVRSILTEEQFKKMKKMMPMKMGEKKPAKHLKQKR